MRVTGVAALLAVMLLAGTAVAGSNWTESGSATVVRGTTYCLDFEGVLYNITPNDFNKQLDSVYLSVICGQAARDTILSENECFEWGDRIKILLTDISTDSSKTTRAHMTFYTGDSLEPLVSEDVQVGLTVSASQYDLAEHDLPEPELPLTPPATATVTAITVPPAPTPSRERSLPDIAATVRRGIDKADAANRESALDHTVEHIGIEKPNASKLLCTILLLLVAGVVILLIHRKLLKRGQ